MEDTNRSGSKFNQDIVKNVSRQMEDADRGTLLEIGLWATDARAKGLHESDVRGVINDTFGTPVSSR